MFTRYKKGPARPQPHSHINCLWSAPVDCWKEPLATSCFYFHLPYHPPVQDCLNRLHDVSPESWERQRPEAIWGRWVRYVRKTEHVHGFPDKTIHGKDSFSNAPTTCPARLQSFVALLTLVRDQLSLTSSQTCYCLKPPCIKHTNSLKEVAHVAEIPCHSFATALVRLWN